MTVAALAAHSGLTVADLLPVIAETIKGVVAETIKGVVVPVLSGMILRYIHVREIDLRLFYRI